MKFDLIVVGGGVSGITAAAHAAQSGRKTLLLEAGERLGGLVHTWQPRDDFWLELGAHTAYNSYGALLGLYAAGSTFDDLLARQKVGYHFFEAGKVRSPMSRLGFIEAATHLPFGLGAAKTDRNLEDYYSQLLGRGNWQRLLAPAFAAVLSQPAAQYPADWLFRKKPRVKAAPRKFTHAEGLQAWLQGLSGRWPLEARLNSAVTGIEVQGPDSVVVRVEGADLQAGRVLLATAPQAAGRLLAGVLPSLAPRLVETPAAEIETLGIVVPAAKAHLPPLAGLIGGDDDFYSVVSRDYLPHPQWRGFAFHFKPNRLDAAGKRRRAAEVVGCAVEDFTHDIEKTNVLPALTPASVRLAADLAVALARQPIGLAGNYLNGLSMGDAAQYAIDRVDCLLAD